MKKEVDIFSTSFLCANTCKLVAFKTSHYVVIVYFLILKASPGVSLTPR